MKSLNPYLLQKMVFLASKTLMSPFGTWKKTLYSTLNTVISHTVRNECIRFGRYVDIEVCYKIFLVKVQKATPILDASPCFQ
jgi:hypothetical protein